MDSVRPFSLLVKPASADCNLRCEYCFYLGKSALYPDARRHRMSDEALESDIYREFGLRKSCWHRACQTCEWLNLCGADCIKHRAYGGSGKKLKKCCGG